MPDYSLKFLQHIELIREENRYREFLDLSRDVGNFPNAKYCGKEIVMWCINDYLGMSRHPNVIEAAKSSLLKNGLGAGGTRNIGGNTESISQLESTIASLHNKERALVFTSGYIANEATITSIAQIMPDIAFFSDELNHASIISGISNSRAQKYIYKHLDINDLEDKLKSVPIDQPKMIIFESAYSMNGYVSPIEDICQLAQKYNAMTYIDEVHSVGLYGSGGAGIAEALGFAEHIDIIQGTLAKAYGAIGGYITGKNDIIDAIRLTSRGFIFTTSIPPLIADAANASIKYLKNSDKERNQHQQVVAKVKSALRKANIEFLENNTHIVPIMINDAKKAADASRMLLDDYGIFIQHINFPTVPKDTERLRITPTPFHTDEMIGYLVKSLSEVLLKLNC